MQKTLEEMTLPERLKFSVWKTDPEEYTPFEKDVIDAANELETLKMAYIDLHHKYQEAMDARDRERARGDIAIEFIKMVGEGVEIRNV